MIGYSCNKCGTKLTEIRDDRFIADDGRYLCNKCAKGVVPCSDKIRDKFGD